jgi:Mg/Co/Ni transporter MgtE
MTERETLLDKLAQQATDNADMDALTEFFYDDQYRYFENMDEAELAEAVAEFDEDEDESE